MTFRSPVLACPADEMLSRWAACILLAGLLQANQHGQALGAPSSSRPGLPALCCLNYKRCSRFKFLSELLLGAYGSLYILHMSSGGEKKKRRGVTLVSRRGGEGGGEL